MSYESGTSTGPNDLIDKLRIFLVADSWTVDDFSSVGAGYRLHVHKAASDATNMYFNFRSAIAETGTTLITENNNGGASGTVTGLIINGSTGYDAGELWHHQPGKCENGSSQSYGGCMTAMSVSAIPAYYFFSTGDSVHIAVETTAGKFQFISFGMLYKQGTITGCQYFSASFSTHEPTTEYAGTQVYSPKYFTVLVAGSSSGSVYITADGTTSWRRTDSSSTVPEIAFPCVSGQSIGNSVYSKGGIASFFWQKSPNAYNAMAAMCPIYTFLLRSDNNYSLIGWPEGVRFLNVTNYTSGDELTYGAESWVVFNADSMAIAPVNLYCGFAFKKVV